MHYSTSYFFFHLSVYDFYLLIVAQICLPDSYTGYIIFCWMGMWKLIIDNIQMDNLGGSRLFCYLTILIQIPYLLLTRLWTPWLVTYIVSNAVIFLINLFHTSSMNIPISWGVQEISLDGKYIYRICVNSSRVNFQQCDLCQLIYAFVILIDFSKIANSWQL